MTRIFCLLLFLVVGCESENYTACMEKDNLMGCNHACDIENEQKACAKRVNIAETQCKAKGDVQVCKRLCGLIGQPVLRKLGCEQINGLCASKDSEACQAKQELESSGSLL